MLLLFLGRIFSYKENCTTKIVTVMLIGLCHTHYRPMHI